MAGKLTDKELATLGKKYKKAQAAETDAKKDKKAAGDAIVAEMQARGTGSITHAGVQITLVEPEETEYDEIGILRSKFFKPWRHLISKVVLDKKELARLVAAGEIPIAKVNRFATIKEKAAYPSVTLKGS